MADREHPDLKHSFHLNLAAEPESDGVGLDHDSPPPVPEDIKIRWRGLLSVLLFVLLLAAVSRVLDPFAASILAVVLVLGLAGWAIIRRRGYGSHAGDGWFAGGGGDVDSGGFDGGGGGGDC